MVKATTFTLFKANTRETTKKVPRPQGRGTSFVVAANGHHLSILALNRVNVVAVATIQVLHVGVIGHHVPCRCDFMFSCRSYHARLRTRGIWGALPSGRGVWGGLRLPREAGVFGERRAPSISSDNLNPTTYTQWMSSCGATATCV